VTKLFSPAILGSLILAAPSAARAGGYFSGTQGARAMGRAGAFTVKADDLSAVTFNPAGLARLRATLIQGGNRFSYNAHSFTRAPTLDWGNTEAGVPPYVEFPRVDNQRPWQLLGPILGVASSLGLRDWGFALAAHAPPGVSRQEFPVGGGQRYMMLSREAVILDYTASAAWKYRELFGFGLSLQWIAVPRLSYELVIDANQFPGEVNPVDSELDMRARVSGSDPFTANAIVGAWYRPVDFLELGASLQFIPTSLETESTLSVVPLSPEIDDDVQLRRDGEPANDVSLSLPLPLTARLGIRYRHLRGGAELFDVELDLGYESWSRVERFAMEGEGLIANLLAQRLDVGSIQIEKRWRDTLSVQLGGDVAVLPERLTLRGGLFYESATADRRYAHVDFASGQQLGGTLGLSVFVQGLEMALAYEYRHQPRLEVGEAEARVLQEVPGSQCLAPFTNPDTCHPQYLGRGAPAVNAGTYLAHSHVMALDLLYRF
jgi:long-subunit fatty acid transport protein